MSSDTKKSIDERFTYRYDSGSFSLYGFINPIDPENHEDGRSVSAYLVASVNNYFLKELVGASGKRIARAKRREVLKDERIQARIRGSAAIRLENALLAGLLERIYRTPNQLLGTIIRDDSKLGVHVQANMGRLVTAEYGKEEDFDPMRNTRLITFRAYPKPPSDTETYLDVAYDLVDVGANFDLSGEHPRFRFTLEFLADFSLFDRSWHTEVDDDGVGRVIECNEIAEGFVIPCDDLVDSIFNAEDLPVEQSTGHYMEGMIIENVSG